MAPRRATLPLGGPLGVDLAAPWPRPCVSAEASDTGPRCSSGRRPSSIEAPSRCPATRRAPPSSRIWIGSTGRRDLRLRQGGLRVEDFLARVRSGDGREYTPLDRGRPSG